jgi:hypothetical protein
MSNFYKEIKGLIIFISIIDRNNIPISFFNFDNIDNDFQYQIMCYSSLDLLKRNSQKNNYLGLIFSFYEKGIEYGSYGYVGNNGTKICVIKELKNENEINEKMHNICRNIYIQFIQLLLNPFFDYQEFNKTNSEQKKKFSQNIIEYMKKNQLV